MNSVFFYANKIALGSTLYLLVLAISSTVLYSQSFEFDWEISITELKKKHTKQVLHEEVAHGIHTITYYGELLNRPAFKTYVFNRSKITKISFAFFSEEYIYESEEREYFKVRDALTKQFGKNQHLHDERGLSSVWKTDKLEVFHNLSSLKDSKQPIHYLEFRQVK